MKANIKVWKRLQDLAWERYLESSAGIFSVDGLEGAEATGCIINSTIPGKCCLDIGCGALPLPSYIKVAPDVTFTGIDPYKGDCMRSFEFINGIAEDLPIKDRYFDAVLFASSLNHLINPVLAVKEAERVLKKGGYIFVWTGLVQNHKIYRQWLKNTSIQYDSKHTCAFTEESLLKLFGNFKVINKKTITKKEFIFTFKR